MAQVTVLPARDDLPRGGAGRAVAGLTAATTLFMLNRALSQADCGLGVDPTKVQMANEFIYCITGQVLRMAAGGGDLFDFTGLTPVHPGYYQKYFFLVDRDENVRVQEAVPARVLEQVLLSNLSPNPYEATVKLLNDGPTGWAVVGGLAILVSPEAGSDFEPGVDPFSEVADGGKLDDRNFIDGFDGTVLLPAVGTETNQVLV